MMATFSCVCCGTLTWSTYCGKRCERKHVYSETRNKRLELYKKYLLEPQKCALNEIVGHSCGMLCSIAEEACDQLPIVSKFCGQKHADLYDLLLKRSEQELLLEFLQKKMQELKLSHIVKMAKLESEVNAIRESIGSSCEDSVGCDDSSSVSKL
uniref:Gamma-B protein n=1 Tax=Barley stripe mosaic virus TaxID=12327 RepID=A0A023VZ72_BSMV|nr:gamma-B protein [Barley stripe mosaic virus]